MPMLRQLSLILPIVFISLIMGCSAVKVVKPLSKSQIEQLTSCRSAKSDVEKRLEMAGYQIEPTVVNQSKTNFLLIEHETIYFGLGAVSVERFRQYRLTETEEGTLFSLLYRIVDYPHSSADEESQPTIYIEELPLTEENLDILKAAQVEACGIDLAAHTTTEASQGNSLIEKMTDFISQQCRDGDHAACTFLLKHLSH